MPSKAFFALIGIKGPLEADFNIIQQYQASFQFIITGTFNTYNAN